jgi:hypothetical protein
MSTDSTARTIYAKIVSLYEDEEARRWETCGFNGGDETAVWGKNGH